MATAYVIDKEILERLVSEFGRYNADAHQALRVIDGEFRKNHQYLDARVRDWHSVVEMASRLEEEARRQHQRMADGKSAGSLSRDAYRAFIQCQRWGVKNASGNYQFNLGEGHISSLPPDALRYVAEKRLHQARIAQEVGRQAYEQWRSVYSHYQHMLDSETPKATGRLKRYRQQLDRYSGISLTNMIAQSVGQFVSGIASAISDSQSLTENTTDAHNASHSTSPDPSESDSAITSTSDGHLYGSYADLKAHLKNVGASGSRSGDKITYEAHHLLEDRLMKIFGIGQEEGYCVAVEANEHMQALHGKFGVDFHLPKGKPGELVAYDIWDVVDGHATAYEENGRPEWAQQARKYAYEQRQRIIDAYRSGIVPWATEEYADEVARYLETLGGDSER